MLHLVDLTMFFAPKSGGVKRYLTQKLAWVRRTQAMRHTLLIPGPRSDWNRHKGLATVASPRIPFGHGYRLPVSPTRWTEVLDALEPDLIEAGDPYQLAWLALRAGRRLQIPVVGFYHSDLPRLLETRLGAVARRLAAAYVSNLYRRFDLVLAPSQAMVARLQALGVARAIHQPLGVDTQVFRPLEPDPGIRRRLGLVPATRLLLYVGRFSREKNIPVLLRAMERLGQGYHLLLVGAGAHLRVPANVSVHPYQSSTAELVRLLNACDALVHPGDQETFGLVVLEAMACGRPVIGTNAGAVAELVDADTGVLAEPRNAVALAAEIRALFDADVERMGRAARRKVERRYSWDRVLAQLMTHYAGLPHFDSGQISVEPVAVHALR
jgi:alpha-1,6-mannosyltransferase